MWDAVKPCPFCGQEVDSKNPDTLYPSGTGWIQQETGMITYHSFREVPKEQWCWGMHCVETSGGCGAEVNGNSRQEAMDKWNRRSKPS